MFRDVAIRAEGLGKKYVLGPRTKTESYVALRDVIARQTHRFVRSAVRLGRGRRTSTPSRTEEFWALRNVNFEVKRGEVLGIIGHNGAGKSTLLKVLSRITQPSEGRVTIDGRIATLLEVGTGFHPELTGRENIYLNGAVLGMSRAEIRGKFDHIVSFAEVERFLDTPVKRYSSGMYVRLAFAVAAHLEPEIIIVDEVLAVGDAEFQKRCLGKMSEIADGGRTVLLVSHNMAAIQTLCPRAIHLDSGVIVNAGVTAEVISRYLENALRRVNSTQASSLRIHDGLEVEYMKCIPEVIRTAESLDIEITFRTDSPGCIRECAILIYSTRGVRVAIVDVRESNLIPFRYRTGRIDIRARIISVPLVEGVYLLGLYLKTECFSGDILDLSSFAIGSLSSEKYVPYPAEMLGIVIPSTVVSILGR